MLIYNILKLHDNYLRGSTIVEWKLEAHNCGLDTGRESYYTVSCFWRSNESKAKRWNDS